MRIKTGYSLVYLCLFALLVWGLNCSNHSTSSETDLATGDTTGTTDTTDTTSDTSGTTDTAAAIIAGHEYALDPATISTTTLDQIRNSYNIFYGHTSHGSQIITGLNMLASENSRYNLPSFHELSDDLGSGGDTSWVPPTRTWLNAHPECNMVIWSWCGGCSDNTVDGINAYLAAMEALELGYPNVQFVYMTGHLDGTGPDGNLYRSNNQIRAFCNENGKILFDFADIESYDPDGNYYPNESDACAWCESWCGSHTCVSCGDCAHSHCFNCYRKGQAFWRMMEEIVSSD